MKKGIIISSIIIICLLVAYPFIMKSINNMRLEKSVNLVNEYLDGYVSYDDVIKYLDKKKSSNSLNDSISKYVRDILADLEEVNVKDISLDDIDKDQIVDYLKMLNDNKDKIDVLKEKTYSYEIDDDIKDRYNELISKVDKNKISNYFDNIINDMNSRTEMIKLLDSNKSSWNIEDDSLVFSKRKLFSEFLEKYGNILNTRLVDDKEGPVITANDITIYKGDKLDISSKIKCIDGVDDTVNCNVEGTYDVNKVGSYSIKISSKDANGNETSKNIKVVVREKSSSKKPYYVHVIRNQNVVVVYGLDANDKYTNVVKTFVCSVGRNNWTPTGTYTTSDKAKWGKMSGGVYAQYYTRITGPYLFHSVPYFTKDKGNLEWEEYNKLGSAASLGCIRLAVIDAKWLYDNLPKGTTIKIYDGDLPSGVTKPSAIKIDKDSSNKGWDPTDPDKNNPWKK